MLHDTGDYDATSLHVKFSYYSSINSFYYYWSGVHIAVFEERTLEEKFSRKTWSRLCNRIYRRGKAVSLFLVFLGNFYLFSTKFLYRI